MRFCDECSELARCATMNKCLRWIPSIQRAAINVKDGDFVIEGCTFESASPALPDEAGKMKPISEYSDERADIEGCKRFHEAMLEKLSIKRAEGKYGWNDPDVCSTRDLAVWLDEHFKKGDPVDIANYCMMIWNRVNPNPPQKGST